MKKLVLILSVVFSFALNAQNYGRIIVYSKSGQQFLISFNGIRPSNEYAAKTVLSYADDVDYKVRIWFPRNTAFINFNITGGPGYETVYLLETDQYGAYVLNLESKIAFTAIPPGNSTPTPPSTVVATPTTVIITEMKDADFKAKLNSVKNESFDDKRIAKLNFLFKDEYISSAQAAELVKLFSFDTKKVDAGKILYKRTVDKKNYFKVVDAITFDSYKKDLQDWIMKNP